MNPNHARRPRKLVLCFDGTGNKFHGDDSDSNILKIFRMLDRTADDQYHYYQPGIGTYVASGSLSHTSVGARVRSWYKKAKDSAVGSSFDQHVVGGYRFLMRFYCPGDEIYIFGFSRGAYIARFLAEMLDYVGLLSHGNEEMVHFAWKAFSGWQRRQGGDGDPDSEDAAEKRRMFEFMKGFRETFSRPVRRIRFLGLFDTVNSVPRFEAAWMQRSKFPYTARTSARVVRHAVGIDERRAKFRQDLVYQSRPAPHDKKHHHARHARQALHSIHEKYRHWHEGEGEKNQGEKGSGRGRRASKLTVPGVPASSPTRYRAHSRSRSRTRRAAAAAAAAAAATSNAEPSISDACSCVSDDSDDADQDIDEVWFAGGHGDIGGGWEVEVDSRSASHVPLVWMVREATRAGLRFDPDKLEAMGCPVDEPRRDAPAVPDIRVGGTDSNGSTELQTSSSSSSPDDMIRRAHYARIHDSLEFSCGLGKTTVLSWKMMEYLPFRRMDLQPDGSWKPIRWPLPAGEVRDIPLDARIHGSVIRRLRADPAYRPGNLIVGGGGRGCRVAPREYGTGEWECVADEGDPVGEIWVRGGSGGGGR